MTCASRCSRALAGAFDVVATGSRRTPWPGPSCSCPGAVAALVPQPGRHVFFSFGARRPDETAAVQLAIARMGLAVRALLPNFNSYAGAGKGFYTSHLYHLRTIDGAAPLIAGPHEGHLYTADGRAAAIRPYRCASCRAVHEVGPASRWPQIAGPSRRPWLAPTAAARCSGRCPGLRDDRGHGGGGGAARGGGVSGPQRRGQRHRGDRRVRDRDRGRVVRRRGRHRPGAAPPPGHRRAGQARRGHPRRGGGRRAGRGARLGLAVGPHQLADRGEVRQLPVPGGGRRALARPQPRRAAAGRGARAPPTRPG